MLMWNQTYRLEVSDGDQPTGEELLFLSQNDQILKNRTTWFLWGILWLYIILICELGEAIFKERKWRPSDVLQPSELKQPVSWLPSTPCTGHLPQVTGLTPHFNMILPPPPQLHPVPFFVCFAFIFATAFSWIFVCLFFYRSISELLCSSNFQPHSTNCSAITSCENIHAVRDC